MGIIELMDSPVIRSHDIFLMFGLGSVVSKSVSAGNSWEGGGGGFFFFNLVSIVCLNNDSKNAT